ncbi:MAG: TraX family protein [Tissierellia bacterium]|nr:TraX family protein [Tissierellia bacterium]
MKKTLNASQLKWLALVTMFVDHFAATILEAYGNAKGIPIGYYVYDLFSGLAPLQLTYVVMRLIGRLAFPIYIFLLVEGFIHTRDIKRYILRMAIFALISEIPFDLAFYGQVFETSHQNVFITMTLGLLMLSIMRFFEEKENVAYRLVNIFVALGFYYLNNYLGADYGGYGIILIAITYIFRDQRLSQAIMIGILGFEQFTASLSGLIVYFYNGERGRQLNKYFFYIFYPAHLLLLYLLMRAAF